MCFSLGWLESLLIRLVEIGAIIAILRLFVPWVLSQFGVAGGMIAQIINIVLWAIICIFCIIVVFDLLSCLGGLGGFSLLPRRG